MDLSKGFDSLLHDILFANWLYELHAYGFEINTLKIIYSYLINRTQTVRLNGERNTERQIKSEILQGSLLGVLLFKIYLNDISHSTDADLFNFADDDSLSSVGYTMNYFQIFFLA